jgi:hypothetical protein
MLLPDLGISVGERVATRDYSGLYVHPIALIGMAHRRSDPTRLTLSS